ncbi:MAG: hypothetical protein A3B10_02900 [Candidatus Doudnabacteria bacterium RIFCSPLOWO2_01_FULL_44_21]|uniref:Aspartate ammonia-lyase n=1 Tax=Candidatus Doudnabacteria bacterium RIFCSPLOWO2_01_FULL_44_21 TaxID=1817841 RepID=A0A1F5Q260_9BACT|nr:MAG: hypothetical protein A3B95_03165 [Candidatus Doudnabacteria bacterium RIFCSPHIGHO2_02_FULL_43_13b]OGE96236.1 MAG: hypothetical protein A3B10_02900 [Candidatus Doudnabacteria bacterium RIFCSPLOWO2_01_FULL_44_21]
MAKDLENKINKNSISLAGEFAVLSQLALRGYDANMTLGHTKSVDILVSNPKNHQMYQLEVKTNFASSRSQGSNSKLFGKIVSAWIMGDKHETITSPNLFYCFVNIGRDTNVFRFFIVPSKAVAEYVKVQHQLFRSNGGNDNPMRMFRIGLKAEQYAIPTPTVEQYENNWEFKE